MALFMHLIPTWIVLAVLALSWRWEWIGAVLFVALGLIYAYFAVERGHPEWTVPISCPLFLVGGLFLLNWLYRKQSERLVEFRWCYSAQRSPTTGGSGQLMSICPLVLLRSNDIRCPHQTQSAGQRDANRQVLVKATIYSMAARTHHNPLLSAQVVL